MKFGTMAMGLTLAMLTLANCPAFGDTPGTNPTLPQGASSVPLVTTKPSVKSSFVPKDFNVPTFAEARGFKLVPLGPDLVQIDFDAYMSSIEHLQKTFTRSTGWPHENISAADAMRDMENEQARFMKRESFAYAVLTPDGKRERGSVYVSPSTVDGYDSVVRMWVTKAEYGAGFDAELYKWVVDWMRTDWPFKNTAYPGRAMDWATWDSLVAGNKARASGLQGQHN